MGRFATLLTTDWMVSDMFVPVSPSGTGEYVQAVYFLLRSVENLGGGGHGVQRRCWKSKS